MKILRPILILGLIILLILYFYNQIRNFTSKSIRLSSNKIQNKIKITQISDFHSNKLINLEKLVKEIKKFSPNLLVLTGDIIDRNDKDLHTAIELLDAINSLQVDVYYIKGNHENDNDLYLSFKNEMIKRHIIVLENDSTTIKVNDNMLNIIGLDGTWEEEMEYSISQYENTRENLNFDYYSLLLAHSPNHVQAIIKGNEDLILSGHTHGGQVRLPIVGPIIAPGQGLFPELDKGLYEFKDTILYIDSGLGNSFLPLRAFNPVQFTNIIIEGEFNEIH